MTIKINSQEVDFNDYLENHYLISIGIDAFDFKYQDKGIGSKFELAKELTNKFTLKYADEDWHELDFFDTMDIFLKNNLL